MNVANKLTMVRIFLTVVLITILLFPFYMVNIEFPEILIGTVTVDTKYLIASGIFMIASFTDFLDGFIARKYNMVTDFGKMVDKMLVNSTHIILTADGFVHPIITVVIIFRDTCVDTIKMIAGSKGEVVAAIKTGKVKTALLMLGIIFSLCYNLPFELLGYDVANFLLVLAMFFSVISGVQYYFMNKKILFEKDKNQNIASDK